MSGLRMADHAAGMALHGESDRSFLTAPSRPQDLPYPREIWAGGYDQLPSRDSMVGQLKEAVGKQNVSELAALCGRVLYNTLSHSTIAHGIDDWVFVSTGDIQEMWIRDSAVQISVYFPRLRRHPAMRRLVEGAIKTAAYFTIQDPYGNSFFPQWRQTEDLPFVERQLGRGGWVGTRNYELDSGAYFINLLWNYYASEVRKPDVFLSQTIIMDAVSVLVDTWTVEQHHEDQSMYRYAELPREGKGKETGYTGLTWTGFRPSDDQTIYPYSIPSNIYAAGALQKVVELNSRIWKDDDLAKRATKLLEGVESGIRKYGVVKVENGVQVYAYEVNGLGDAVTDLDDANIPSLLSIPLLGWTGYDPDIYQNTRKRLLDPKTNTYYFRGATIEGIGSPHTGPSMTWSLSVVVRALTAGPENVEEAAEQLRMLLRMQCGTGAMHESVNVDRPEHCTRQVFQWANAAAVTAIEGLLGVDCDEEAEKERMRGIVAREKRLQGEASEINPLYFETLESAVVRDGMSKALQEFQRPQITNTLG